MRKSLKGRKKEEGRFVLATDILDHSRMNDEDFLKAYKGQASVETNFKWAKNAVAPIFLSTPKRIAVLGFV